MSGVIPLLPIHAFMVWTGETVHFTFLTSRILNITLRKEIKQITKFAKHYFSRIGLVFLPRAKYTLKTHVVGSERQSCSQPLWTVCSVEVLREILGQKR
jgi:hypothetical protein